MCLYISYKNFTSIIINF